MSLDPPPPPPPSHPLRAFFECAKHRPDGSSGSHTFNPIPSAPHLLVALDATVVDRKPHVEDLTTHASVPPAGQLLVACAADVAMDASALAAARRSVNTVAAAASAAAACGASSGIQVVLDIVAAVRAATVVAGSFDVGARSGIHRIAAQAAAASAIAAAADVGGGAVVVIIAAAPDADDFALGAWELCSHGARQSAAEPRAAALHRKCRLECDPSAVAEPRAAALHRKCSLE
eukprot:365174-Chlamydomonas_euryale.AAC.1